MADRSPTSNPTISPGDRFCPYQINPTHIFSLLLFLLCTPTCIHKTSSALSLNTPVSNISLSLSFLKPIRRCIKRHRSARDRDQRGARTRQEEAEQRLRSPAFHPSLCLRPMIYLDVSSHRTILTLRLSFTPQPVQCFIRNTTARRPHLRVLTSDALALLLPKSHTPRPLVKLQPDDFHESAASSPDDQVLEAVVALRWVYKGQGGAS